MSHLLAPARRLTGLTDLALLVARVAVGVVLFAHGWQKGFEFTPAGTAGAFGEMGVPAAGLVAWYTMLAELIGGAALVLGVLTPVFALLNLLSMVGAFFLVHVANGVFVTANGYELVLSIAAALVAVAAFGAGRWSVDGFFLRTGERTGVTTGSQERTLVG
ncbi:DoxX family protein [Ornithinimicrobium murale]|uniref:DoxX family protein n=1 Tax=Ornithinimicrobium murale TaxID=1050153 RepID=UPI000E0D0189|nr:DoxX family protein [Ornithinimicrobium murale]